MKKDIEKALENMKPKRSLSSDFTAETLAMVKSSVKKRFFNPMPLLRRAPILVCIVGVLLISGGAYAAFHWPEITAKFGTKIDLPSGNSVIGVDTTNCNYFQVHNKPASAKGKVYYEVKKDSSLSQDQIVDMVKGVCEEEQALSAVNNIVPSKVVGDSSAALDIKAISKSSITVQLNKFYQDPKFTYNKELTYTKIASNLLVYDAYQPIKYSDLKVGNTVMLVAKDGHTLPSEGDPSNSNHWADPDLMTILAIVKVPSPSASPTTFYMHLGKDFVRTDPCITNPSGFCRAYGFSN
jgi:hypothetical protein